MIPATIMAIDMAVVDEVEVEDGTIDRPEQRHLCRRRRHRFKRLRHFVVDEEALEDVLVAVVMEEEEDGEGQVAVVRRQ